MKRVIIVASVFALVLAMGWSSSHCQAAATAAPAAALHALTGPHGEFGPRGERGPEGKAGTHRPHPGLRIHMLLMVALRAPEARDDAEAQRLVDKIIADRKEMIEAESNRLTAFESLVRAVRSGDKEAVKSAREELKDATDKLRAEAKQLREDLKALKDRLDELGVKPRRRGENGPDDPTGKGRRRGRQPRNDDDVPLNIE